MSPQEDSHYDVAIVGAGVAGSTLGAILARHGLAVLILDAGTHPRFVLGESVIPYASVMMKVLAERYDVPELAALSNFRDTTERVSTMCGQKQNFGFVYHRHDRRPDPALANQIVLPTWFRNESHWFRQDIDAYLFTTAVRYGATHRLNTRVADIQIDAADGVTLESTTGQRFRARYLVDASGFNSLVAERFGLREQPTRARTHSRTLFTHMVGVAPFDEVSDIRYGQPNPWHNGTLHHVFEGGWLWVIPFDNHDRSRNPLCSVGLTLLDRTDPEQRPAPEREFEDFLRRFPAVARQFRDARTVRPWVSTGRLQNSVSRTVGDRYCLTATAAGTVDALFSRGIANSFEIVNALARRIIDAASENDWATARFAEIDSMQQRLFDAHDDLVYASYVAFRDYELWNAMIRVWDTYSFYAAASLEHTLGKYVISRDDSLFRGREGGDSALARGLRELLVTARTICGAVERGELDAGVAAGKLIDHLNAERFWPDYMPHGTPEIKFFDMNQELAMRVMHWSRTEAPHRIRESFA
ncbi:NAD(P)/FAD-dependent oxidoreductase [Nocardia otitidiscaviarum]|uniref:NAD(P)/FAD-dependent oxidoreductase n=1 Tax=Nocardia otitidiscaviarum TaxID=1823 RepID=UPI001895FB01|nr:NAD(P)/FAD-dependent oxidoreductase [Nocardia otitidiscaviarum]MBF6241068.1 NAD(P)/FAD-dependent oxidoreductase [Nocardia otitidiscaviarum]